MTFTLTKVIKKNTRHICPRPISNGALIVFALTLALSPLASLAAVQPYNTECTGGTITHANGYSIHTFGTTTPSTTFTCPEARSVEYLVVAGGGGGGSGTTVGGGGAGGYRTATGYAVAAGSPVTVTVGGGGAGGASAGNRGATGSASVFGSITSAGGGGGGYDQVDGDPGGSGGGAGGSGAVDSNGGAASPSGQGNAGGHNDWSNASPYASGGGGGAGAAGQNAPSASASGAGGAGLASSISGSSVTYAGGGGGANQYGATQGAGGIGGGGAGFDGNGTNVINATANTGGGGGGGVSTRAGGAGGSGIVIVRYLTSYKVYKFTAECTGGSITRAAGYTVHTFTSSGTFTCSNYGVVEYLVVAGGGPGAGVMGLGGGGGGGGFTTGTGYAVTPGTGVTVTVGAGAVDTNPPARGSSSVFGTITVLGGGQGMEAGTITLYDNYNGGSGGGGAYGSSNNSYPGGNGITGQGNHGGTGQATAASPYRSGGGGGAGGVGLNGVDGATKAGDGGPGMASAISGSPVYYAGGGGGAAANGGGNTASSTGGIGGGGGGGLGIAGIAGTANTGGGGGGSQSANGASGGSGVVIVRYVTPATAAAAKYKILGGKYTFQGGSFKFNYTANTAPSARTYIENVFSAYTYTGTGAALTITNGLNLSSKGGLVWQKDRGTAVGHSLEDTIRGTVGTGSSRAGRTLLSYSTSAELSTTGAGAGPYDITSYTSTGYVLGPQNNSWSNTSPNSYVSWSFAQAPRFFKVASTTVAGGVTQTVDLSSLGTVGMVAVKRTDSTSNWFVWHRSQTSGKLTYLNLTDAETTDGSITLSGTTLSLVGGTIANGTYIVYAWAHDTSANGLIQCGAYSTDGSAAGSVTLGWEPQYVLLKNPAGGQWYVEDSARAFPVTASAGAYLGPNNSSAEVTASNFIRPNATGFTDPGSIVVNGTVLYCAIRRGPMQQPGNGTQVYNAIARTGTGAAATVTGVGFPPDIIISRGKAISDDTWISDRLRGATIEKRTNTSQNESTNTNDLTGFDVMDGWRVGSGAGSSQNVNTVAYINWVLRRYPGVVDQVAWTGTGSVHTEAHNLTVVPELIIVEHRVSNAGGSGATYYGINTKYLFLQQVDAAVTDSTFWNSTSPTSAVFTLGTNNEVNKSAQTFTAYLFASKPGISKVGSYTGDGSNGKVINANFASSARFVMIKRTDSTGDWFVWDTTRGITANANDPHVSWNTAAAEVTTDDSIDPNSSGFMVKQNTATNINVTGATYIYLAFQ